MNVNIRIIVKNLNELIIKFAHAYSMEIVFAVF